MSDAESTFQRAVASHQRGHLPMAEALYKDVLRELPDHDRALHFLGIAAMQGGRKEEGASLIRQSIARNPTNPVSLADMGNCCRELGLPLEAIGFYDRALGLESNQAAIHYNRANALRDLRRYEEALEGYNRAIGLVPQFAAALVNRGNTLRDLGRCELAIDSYQRAVGIQPQLLEAINNWGGALIDSGKPGLAIQRFEQALAIDPGYAPALDGRVRAHWLHGRALLDSGRNADAESALRRALELRPGFSEAACDLGEALLRGGRFVEAQAQFDKILQDDPRSAAARNGLGNLREAQKAPSEALTFYAAALEFDPENPGILSNHSTALLSLGKVQEAMDSADRALAIQPRFAYAHNSRGLALLRLQRPLEALAEFAQALEAAPEFVKARANHANALFLNDRNEEAYDAYSQLLIEHPQWPRAAGFRLHSQLRCCNWTDYQQRVSQVRLGVGADLPIDNPFGFLSVCDSVPLQRMCASKYLEDFAPRGGTRWTGGAHAHDRLRIGYLSADLREHPVSYLMAGVFEQHDRRDFEVIGLSLAPPQDTPYGRRVHGAFDRFIDVSAESDGVAVERIKALEIDILVDLAGHTAGGRATLYAHRLAPLHVNYLGFPGTLGASWIDYIVADPFVIPAEQAQHYSEAIAYLPDCFQANDDRREASALSPVRADLALPDLATVICSFNNAHKLNPTMFDIWMRAMRAAPRSVLWLCAPQPVVERNLRAEAERRGVDGRRLIFAPRIRYAEHLTRLALADLCLDTLPFSAGATASDALFAGVPLLTCAGNSLAARMGASLLNCLGLNELVTVNLDRYESLLIELMQHPERLKALRDKLAKARHESALFDTRRFTRHLESAYRTMQRQLAAGLPPQTFSVAPLPAVHAPAVHAPAVRAPG